MFRVIHFRTEFIQQGQATIIRKVTMTQFMLIIVLTAVGVGLLQAPFWLAPVFMAAGYAIGYTHHGEIVLKRVIATLNVRLRNLVGAPQQEASLMTFLANMVKTVRTFGASVIMIDQDLEAFIGVEGAQAESMASGTNVTAGQFILNNSSWLIAFGMKRDAAFRLVKHFKDEILPSHAEFLARMGSDDRHGKGMAVVRANGKADMVYFQLRPIEAEYLFGS